MAYANNSILLVKVSGSITLSSINGDIFSLLNCLYVPRIKKNLLSIPTLAKERYHVAFEDNKCVICDKKKGVSIFLTSSLTIKNLYYIDDTRMLLILLLLLQL